MCYGWGWGGNERFLIWNVLCQGWGSHIRIGELSFLPGLCDVVQIHGCRALQNLAIEGCTHGRGSLSPQLIRCKVTAQQVCIETGPWDPCSILEGHTVNHPVFPASLYFWCLVPTLPLCFVSGMFILKVSSGNAFPASWQTKNQRRKAESVVITPSKAYLPGT